MRINVYAEEITDRVELVEKDGFRAIRLYTELPVTKPLPHSGFQHHSGPFIHKEGDDDSSAVTFWSLKKARAAFVKAIELIDSADVADREHE